ncbi:MAG TPA: L-tyrosine/L-tryptophan isonitrile synthase family protein [Pseudonocardiaceae bacterium]|nr:L-tyrosine/L-tryptophan isonitrile synthase family protein [Pseudonocardiaceae bacterium]
MLVPTRTVDSGICTPSGYRTHEVRPAHEGNGGAMAADTATATISHARSLRALPLELLHTSAWADRWPVRLDRSEVQALLGTLQANSRDAAARLADNAMAHLVRVTGGWSPHDPRNVAAGLHRILTRSRFLKGSRSCFPLDTAMTQIVPFIEARRPVTILASGFPFKQHDNGLKAAGPRPDLAELGALLRLKELHGAFTALYPPGLQVVVLNDGGYSRPRGSAEIRHYKRQLQRYAQLVGLGNSVLFHDQSCFVARLLGPQGWSTREKYRRTFRELISLLATSPRTLDNAKRADQRLALALPATLLVDVPSFRAILSSLVYSVPVPAPAGADPRQWACEVLAWPDGYTEPGLSPDLLSARRDVVASAWQDSVNYLAASLADAAAGVPRHFPPHIRLATVASRPGCSGFSYLGGSTLLPWHGTGCLDGRGLLCAEFLVSLDHRGFVPVYSELLGDKQPLLMVPFTRVEYAQGRRRVDPNLLAAARLRSR